MTDQTLTIGAREFAALVAPVIPLAGTDPMLPVLNTVHFEVRDGWLLAEATDRFRIGINRTKTETKAFEALVRLRDTRTIRRIFKPHRGENPALTLTVSGDNLRVDRSGGLGFASSTFALVPGQFPSIRHLVAKTLQEEPSPERYFGVNAKFLADWGHACSNGEPLYVRQSDPARPILLAAGSNFIGLQMPLRISDGAVGDFSTWDGVLAEQKKPAPKKPRGKKAAA